MRSLRNHLTQQQGDFRINSMEEVQNADGSFSLTGRYVSHQIYKGPFTLYGLPTAFADEQDTVDTLELTIEDSVTKVQVTCFFTQSLKKWTLSWRG